MLNQTQLFFLRCLADHFHSWTTSTPAHIDCDELYRLAKSHDAVGIIFHQCKKELPDSRLFLQNYSASICYYAGRNQSCNAVTSEFAKNHIPYASVKGQTIAPPLSRSRSSHHGRH